VTTIKYQKRSDKMTIFIRTVWIIATAVLSLAIIWFLLASTAFFNRGIDLVETFIFIFVWAPALVVTVLLWIWLRKGWMPKELNSQIMLLAIIIALTIGFSTALFNRATPYGWLIPVVRSDWTQTTSDGKFEYRLEVINLFQRNARAQLYVRSIYTGDEMIIPTGINARELTTLPMHNRSHSEELILSRVWSNLVPHETSATIYILSTTEILRINIERFEINMETGTAERIR